MNSHDIVLLSTADWENPFWTNKQHVAVELARMGHRVFYVDSVGLRRLSASKRDLHRIGRRLIKAIRSPRRVDQNLWVWSPIVLPWHHNMFVQRINQSLLSLGLKTWMTYLGIRKDWLWTYNPITTRLLDIRKFACTIYHCVDEIKAQPGMPVALLEIAEKELAQRIKIIFTTSTPLTKVRKVWNKHTYYFPNVANFDHFSKALREDTVIPNDLEAIPKPRLGFIGALSGYKVNFKLLREIAESHPEWSVVLIGEIGEGDPWTDKSVLNGCSNLYVLGPRPYRNLPGYLKGIDVALLPNNLNEYTESMFPMKFFEYLAAGKPVVSVSLQSLQEYKRFVSIADSDQKFIDLIERVLAGEAPDTDLGIEIAKRHTYTSRTKAMLEVIEQVCEEG